MLFTNPSTRQLRIVTWAMSTSAGVSTRIPMPPPAFWISVPRQSRVTSDAVMSNPAVYVHDGSSTELTVTWIRFGRPVAADDRRRRVGTGSAAAGRSRRSPSASERRPPRSAAASAVRVLPPSSPQPPMSERRGYLPRNGRRGRGQSV